MMRAMSRSRAFSTAGSEKIAMVGSGNFGSALVRILGRNALKHDIFDNEVKMYVHEEMIDGKPLTSIINETNENVKYLKGAKFTPNVVADPDIASAVSGATMVCFCLPHQFLKPMVPAIKAAAAPGVKCLSAIKGIDFDDKGIVLISDIIRSELSADLAPAGLAFLAVLGVLLLPLLCVASCCAAAERHSLRRDAGSERWSRSRAEPTRLLAPAADSTARQEAPILSRVHEELNGVVPARFGTGSRLLRADRTSRLMRVKQYALVGSL